MCFNNLLEKQTSPGKRKEYNYFPSAHTHSLLLYTTQCTMFPLIRPFHLHDWYIWCNIPNDALLSFKGGGHLNLWDRSIDHSKATIINDWQLQTVFGLGDRSGFQTLWFYKLKDTFKDCTSKARGLLAQNDWKRNEEDIHVRRRKTTYPATQTHSHSSSLYSTTTHRPPWEETLIAHVFISKLVMNILLLIVVLSSQCMQWVEHNMLYSEHIFNHALRTEKC